MPKRASPWNEPAVIQAYATFVGWYKRMADRYNLDDPIAIDRLRRKFWACRRATRESQPFTQYDILESGIKNLHAESLSVPSFAGLINCNAKGLYGVETLLVWGRKKKQTAEDKLMRRMD